MSDLLLKTVLALMAIRPKPVQHYLKRHFWRDPRKNAIVNIELPRFRHGCLTRALHRFREMDGGLVKMFGPLTTFGAMELVDFLHPNSLSEYITGPIQYSDIPLADGTHLSCPKRAFFLFNNRGRKLAVYVSLDRFEEKMVVEVMARERKTANEFLQELMALMDKLSIYKGSVIAVKEVQRENATVEFCTVPKVTEEQVILPPSVRSDTLRITVNFDKHKEKLAAHRRHLKRGLLLYGPPGTGKSLTVMHLISEMPGRTTVLLTGSTIDWMAHACKLARNLQPATIVIDDVDLIASGRMMNQDNSVLFELLNQMDGIADDADILFLLTTNRPEALETAISARPGRIDQAIEIPLPSSECRRRLFDLYAKGLTLKVERLDGFIEKTEGANAAFIRELLRKAALFAAEDESDDMVVTDEHLDKALVLLAGSNIFTSKFLGLGRESAEGETVG